jgi:leucyl-tRNA synthetase
MPGYAGSSWYFLRYMDPHNDQTFCDRKVSDYWNQVDVYIGGTEHAVGHLLYSRLWTKVLHDLGFINFDEPFKKMVNQGMIIGTSYFVQVNHTQKRIHHSDTAVETFRELNREYIPTRVPVEFTDGKGDLIAELLPKFLKENNIESYEVVFNKEGKLSLSWTLEKMSKSKRNVVNPDDMIAQYGADTFRMYEMFLGPIELSKPWDTKGIEGVSRFLRKFWNLFYDENGNLKIVDDRNENAVNTPPLGEMEGALKILHQTIKKIDADIQKLAYNTCVSQFMICVNELQTLKCNKRSILEPLLVLLNPFAPFITEFLWKEIGNTNNVIDAPFPTHDEKYLIENSFTYPIAINGKTRVSMEFALDADVTAIEKAVLENDQVQKFMEGKPMKKFIFVKGRMVNVVV